ncbi:RICIN domain-containing protein [Streptomyces sp. NPDC049585]|uniref:RICIN domain-containing protein n=1 Tax=Streptomyces sp. NPDC049585 TaxID=3155154 RepID=UPI003444B2EE
MGATLRPGRKSVTVAAIGVSAILLNSPASQAANYKALLVNGGSSRCLEVENSSTDNGARVQQWSCNGQPGARWTLEFEAEGTEGVEYFMIVNRNSGKCLEFENSSTDNGARAQQWDCNERLAGHWWRGVQMSNGKWAIENLNSRKVLEISNSSYANGAPAQQWSLSVTAPGQEWIWVKGAG